METSVFRLVAKTTAGLEEILAEELRQLGAENIELLTRAVSFDANQKIMYRANYEARTALRILKPIASFKAANEDKLYDEVSKIHWHSYFNVEKTFAIDAVVGGGRFTHSQFISYKAKDAIVDQFRDRFGERPSVDTNDPDLRINLHIFDDQCSLSLDSSGDSLHKRGYRFVVDKAPINEVLAAGLIMLSGWKADMNFVDSMCGSATIPIEAAMIAMKIPPGYFRKTYGFMKWADYDQQLWEEVMHEADAKISTIGFDIIGSDRSAKAVEIARQNLEKADLLKEIQLFKKPMEELLPPEAPGWLLINPPYGERLEELDLKALYSSIGDSLKRNFKGYKAWVISSDFFTLKHIGLKPSKKYTVYNGPLECRFVCFDIFAGSMKEKKTREAEQQRE
ncbi:MAG: RNA methyltransferase [Bacteroidetes bacterium HGW-Bacteroidetes-1]|jgi:putative N6-adenine-specific DNA methylase|nr:MAG: RNA methyltransferase [Bacteroidetes bacterium HGW-Bacteroidetes-1]